MAVTARTEIQRWMCLSTDTKPTLPAGSEIFESDTGLIYISNGSSWALRPPAIGSGIKASATITRPNNATAYAANDVVGATAAAITFAFTDVNGNAILAPCDILITDVQFEVDVTSIPAGMTTFQLYFYSVTPPSALADNAAHDLPSGDRASYRGRIRGITPADVGSTLIDDMEGVNKRLRLASSNLFAYLVTDGAFTPSAQAAKVITLQGVIV